MNKVKPIHYTIRLEPDLGRFQFPGCAKILIESPQSTKEITLNSLDLAIESVRLETGGESTACAFTLDPDKEILSISFPGEISGRIGLVIDYTGEINDKMRGFYRSRALVGGQEKIIAVTQFEESDARRAFPCFDHPAQKATFEIEMIVEEGLTPISNMPFIEEKRLEDGRVLTRFEKTPRMSTYLLFWGVGEFEIIEDPGEILMRAATMPGTSEQGRFGLAFARKCLAFCERFYGIKYPLPKLDLIAIADFSAGAMENWGAITFRENLLLHDPEIVSRAGEERICEVIAHEIAHQWFGNLVTPVDWKYLWLNESFATYFGYGVVHHYYPDWGVWDQFLISQTRVALDRDALQETFPIELPGGEHVIINAASAPIIYNKGGSVLRQVEAYVGKGAFKKGLQGYLKDHAYDCASSHDLWEALEAVSDKPVSRMMRGWIEQPGFPLVEVRRSGDKLLVSQSRFSFLPGAAGEPWLIPIDIDLFMRNGEKRRLTTLMDTGETIIELVPDALAYKVNAGQKGFYRVRYHDPENLGALAAKAEDKTLSPEDRWGLQDDLYALARRGDVPVRVYLDFISHYTHEDAFLPLTSIASNLFHAHLIMGKDMKKTASPGRKIFERVLRDIGYEPRPDEAVVTSVLRDQILWHCLVYGSEEAADFAMTRFRSLEAGEKIHPDIMKNIMQAGAFLGDREAFDWLAQRFSTSENEHERMNILAAMGCFRETSLIDAARIFTLERVPPRNRFVPVSALAVNPHAVDSMWDWYLSNQKVLEELHPMHYERVIAAIVPFGGIGREEEVRAFFHEHMERTEKARDVIKLSLEIMTINARMKNSEL